MTSRASRLLALYGLFALLTGALGFLSEEGGDRIPYVVAAAVGAAAVVCSSMMKKDALGAFAAAPVIAGVGLLAGLWYGVLGWAGVAAERGGVFVSATVFTLIGIFSAVLIPTMIRTWKVQRRFFHLFENDR